MKIHRTLFAFVVLAAVVVGGCVPQDDPGKCYADAVIFGKIFTADKDNSIAESAAIREGKFVFVGAKEGVSDFIGPQTAVLDFSRDGLVTPGFTEGHAHYVVEQMAKASLSVYGIDDKDALSKAVKDFVAAHPEKTAIYGKGWNFQVYFDTLTREWLDELCPDTPIYIADTEGHKGVANTAALRNAFKSGQMYEWDIDTPLTERDSKNMIPGGKILLYPEGHKDAGKMSGCLVEGAGTYVRQMGLGATFTDEEYEDLCQKAVCRLNELGFTNYVDGWLNFEGCDGPYKAFRSLDDRGAMTAVVTGSYEIEGWSKDYVTALDNLVEHKEKYSSRHFRTDHLKIFIDGTTEGMTACNILPYKTGENGICNWSQFILDGLCAYATQCGIICHCHSYGDGANMLAVESLTRAVDVTGKRLRHTLVHVRNIREEDVKRCAEYGFTVAAGMNWHAVPDDGIEPMRTVLDDYYIENMYPMKSLMDAGVNLTGASDAPATSGFPGDPYGIMEVAVTCSYEGSTPIDTKEALSREEVLRAFTINGAHQVGLEDERGSIEVGKWADFVVADGDILTCPADRIKYIKNLYTFFEGQMVFSLNN